MPEEFKHLGGSIDAASAFIVNYGFQFIGAIIILIIGWQTAKWAARIALKLCERAHLDITLAKFFASIAKSLVLVFVIIIALGKFGITITPFVAAIGAIAYGGTLALQEPLSNYGAGLAIILARPFVVGNTIKIQGVTGVVEEIRLAYTQLSNEDGAVITIPNKRIAGEVLFNTFSSLVVESIIRVSYRDDPQKVIKIIEDILQQQPDVARKPAPLVGIEKFGEAAFEIGLRYWLPTSRYYELLYAVNGEIYRRLNSQGVSFASPQLDVHMTRNGA